VQLRRIVLATSTVAILAIAVLLLARAVTGPVDRRRAPETVFETNPFRVGETYTLGSTGPPDDVKLPFRLTGVDVVHLAGVEVIGRGALDGTGREVIGLDDSWPPDARYEVLPFDPQVERSALTLPLLGIRVLQPLAGLRGVEVRWIDADGVAGSRVFDLAVYTCPRTECPAGQDGEVALRRLGLMR
jgi:hypothetical protein